MNKNDLTWTNPKHMTIADWAKLKYIKQLLEKGKFAEAMDYACWHCDTAIRDEIPATVWKLIGGKLLPQGEANLEKEKGIIFFKGQPMQN